MVTKEDYMELLAGEMERMKVKVPAHQENPSGDVVLPGGWKGLVLHVFRQFRWCGAVKA